MEEMPDGPVSRTWLESLSTAELIKLADSFGIDIPLGLERIFIIEELLEYSDTDIEEKADDLEINPAYIETTVLPKQYNISYIEVIIRDPLWVFVYWEIKGHDREVHEHANDFKGYCLRVVPLNERNTELNEASFTVPVNADDSARYLGFAEHSSQSHGCYIIRLAVIRGNSELPVAESLPFRLPRLIENEEINAMKENPLFRFSGVQDLSIIKNTDRRSKVKRH
jgi:uncharacterized protein